MRTFFYLGAVGVILSLITLLMQDVKGLEYTVSWISLACFALVAIVSAVLIIKQKR